MRIAIIVAALLVAACSERIDPEDAAVVARACKSIGGTAYVRANSSVICIRESK